MPTPFEPAPRLHEQYLVSLDEVRLVRQTDCVAVEYLAGDAPTTTYTGIPDLGEWSDADILGFHNDAICGRNALTEEYRDRPLIEIPIGQPQISCPHRPEEWGPRGNVLRCHITDDDNGETAIGIDDLLFTMEEFGQLLRCYVGWGVRLEFVDESDLHQRPKSVDVREPADGE